MRDNTWMQTMAVAGFALSAGALIVVMVVGVAAAQSPLEREVAKFLRVEQERTSRPPGGPTVEGQVYNNSGYRVGSIRLRVETLDTTNQVIGETMGWVYGNIKSGTSWPFKVRPAKDGASFRVTVESFFVIAREASTESP